MRLPVSVLVLTLNESANIDRCLDALSWSDDIVVLDSFSTDGTPARAASRGARVHQRAFDNFAKQRNHALDAIGFKHEWVLHLDADEVVTDELRNEIALAIQRPGHAAYRISGKLMFMGKWLRFSGMYPAYQVRLGRREVLRFEQVGHGQRETLAADQVGTLRASYVHFGFSRGIGDWIERHNRYSTDEAKLGIEASRSGKPDVTGLFAWRDPVRRRRALKQLACRLPCRPLLRFIYMYFLRLGFLDGRPGLVYCRLVAMYEYWTILKMRELKGV